MALVSMRQLLDHAAEFGYGVPAFNVNNLEQMRAITVTARSSTRKARRDAERRDKAGAATRSRAAPAASVPPEDLPATALEPGSASPVGSAAPFEVIEQW